MDHNAAPSAQDADAALARGASLADRLRCGPTAGRPGPEDEPRAARRLGRWSAQPPFNEPPWWERRLAGAGLTEATLQVLLAEPAPALAARLAPRPEWLAELETAYWPGEAEADRPGPAAGSCSVDPGPEPDAPFAGLAEPLLARARQRLAARLAALPPVPLRLDPPELLTWLYPPLPRLVDRMLRRTMVLELNVARVLGTLPAGSSAARFDAFCARLHEPAERRRLVETYPVLGRMLATVAENWVQASALFATRLASDWPLLAGQLGRGGALGPVTGVASGLGDPHRGGQTVLAVAFGCGADICYKPRPVAVDRHVQCLLDWLAAHGLSTPVRVPHCVDRGAYGWVELVTARPCASEAELRRFYHRQGVLLAVLYLLRASDLSADNLVACGEHPMLVDLEAVCQPELTAVVGDAPAAEQAAMAAASASVLRVGLLPVRSWHTAAGDSADLSGLGGAPGQMSPIALPEVAGAGTDLMHLRLRRRPLAPAANRPVAAGSPLRVLDYAEDIVAGFTETYELCLRHRGALLAGDGPLAAFHGDQVRVIVRSTAEYALLRDTGHHPDVLRDGLDADRHLDRLWRGVSRRPALAACVESERADLWQQDIPVFTARTDEPVLRSSTGVPVPGLVRRTGMDSVRQVVAGLGPADLARQCWLVRTSLATRTMDLREIEYASYPLPDSRLPAGPDRLLAGADAVGQHLARIAYQAPDSVEWLGVVSNRGADWSLGPLGPDLYTGLSGLAMFFGFLGALSGDPEHTALARAALATARSQVDRRTLPRMGGGAGLGGIIYACTQLGVVWDDEELLDYAVSLAVLNGEWTVDDEQFDFTSGSAGSVAALRALYAVRPTAPVRGAVRACADRLLAGQQPAGHPGGQHPDGQHPGGQQPAGPVGCGAAWLPRAMREGGIADVPLAGLAHGAAGVAWPLLEAAELCADQRYRDAASAAIAYERSLFVPAAGTWRDLRREAGGAPFELSAWCHGAAGVGLARVRSLPHLAGDGDAVRAEIRAAVDHTLRAGFGLNHSLCHGDIGNLELLVLAGEALAEPRWCEQAQGLMGAVMDAVDEHGWISGVPHGVQTPGLLHGLAGTGYGMLRMAAPGLVPPVLTFGPPPPRRPSSWCPAAASPTTGAAAPR